MSTKAQLLNALAPEGEVRLGEIVIRGDSSVEADGFRRDDKNYYRIHPSRLPEVQKHADALEAWRRDQERQLRLFVERGEDLQAAQAQHTLQRALEAQQWDRQALQKYQQAQATTTGTPGGSRGF